LPECCTPGGKILLEKMLLEIILEIFLEIILEIFLEIILDRTLPAGAVPARLLRSGEYSIRGTFDLIRQSSLYCSSIGSRTLWSTARGYRVIAAMCRHCCSG
jgi:hypothetical protein